MNAPPTPSNKRLKVLMLSHELMRLGAQKAAIEIIETLSDKMTTRVLALGNGPLYDRLTQSAEVKIVQLLAVPREQLDWRGRIVQYLLRMRIAKWAADFAPDLIYVNTVAALQIAQLLPLPRVPVLLHIHEMGQTLRHYLDKSPELLTEWPSRYIVVSEQARKSLMEQYHIPPQKITVINAFVMETGFLERPMVDHRVANTFTVGGSGFVSWRKGIDLWLLMAVAVKNRIKSGRVRFMWVGHTENADFLAAKEKVHLLGLNDDVEFIAATPDPLPYYSAFDVFAMTSWEDPCPIVVLECMMLRKPVVCFAGGGGAAEEIGDTGIVIPEFSPSMMAEVIVDLLDSPDRRALLGEKARRRVQSDFTNSVQVPKIWSQVQLAITPGPGETST